MNKCWNVLFVVVSCMQVYIILLTVISEDEKLNLYSRTEMQKLSIMVRIHYYYKNLLDVPVC